jgi:hypothetical protein
MGFISSVMATQTKRPWSGSHKSAKRRNMTSSHAPRRRAQNSPARAAAGGAALVPGSGAGGGRPARPARAAAHQGGGRGTRRHAGGGPRRRARHAPARPATELLGRREQPCTKAAAANGANADDKFQPKLIWYNIVSNLNNHEFYSCATTFFP